MAQQFRLVNYQQNLPRCFNPLPNLGRSIFPIDSLGVSLEIHIPYRYLVFSGDQRRKAPTSGSAATKLVSGCRGSPEAVGAVGAVGSTP